MWKYVSKKFTYIVLLRKLGSKNCILTLSVELVKAESYDVLHPCDGLQKSLLFFK
jgi:hypothetical protein